MLKAKGKDHEKEYYKKEMRVMIQGELDACISV
jgi:hypothetical protein